MKNRLIYLAVVILFPLVLSPQVYYNHTFSFGALDHPVAFISDQAGSVYVCGWFEDANHENQSAFALKININGDEVWRATIEDSSKFMALCITASGHIALAGNKNNHCFLSLVSSESGTEIWSYQEEVSEGFWFCSVNEITNGTDYRLHAARTTNATHLIQYYVFDSESGNYIVDVEDINNIFSPVFVSGQISPNQIWFACEGLVICNNYNGLCGFWMFSALHIAGVDRYSPDKGCVVRLFAWGSEYYIGVLTKTLEGNIVYGNAFEIVYPNFNVKGSGILGSDKILVTGTIEDELAVWFIDYALTNMYERTYQSDPPRMGVDVLGLPSNDMVIMGTETGSTGDETDIFLMKLDADGLVSTGEITEGENIRIYPNPGNEEIKVRIAVQHKQSLIELFDLKGRLVLKENFTGTEGSINSTFLPSGTYIYKITSNDGLFESGKWVKQ